MIDWQSDKNEILFNPRMPEPAKVVLFHSISQISHLKSHCAFATSGSSGQLKWALLSKSAVLTSANAVNSHLECNKKDIWLNPLPDFHVGGVGIIARGYLIGAKVIPCNFPNFKWNPEHFIKQLRLNHVTLTSMVPAQIFDLVSLGYPAPASLRGIIIGGGALSEKIYFAALKLGWRLLPSYGLTECASQVATAEFGSWNLSTYPLLKPLKHVQLAVDKAGFLNIKSDALLTSYLEVPSSTSSKKTEQFLLRDPKKKGWLKTEDQVIFEGQLIKSISRGENFIKIGGESVDLLRLENILEEVKLSHNYVGDLALTALIDERLGYRLHLAVVAPLNEEVKNLVLGYHQRVFPFERIHQIHHVKEIPRSPLNKPLRLALNFLISNEYSID